MGEPAVVENVAPDVVIAYCASMLWMAGIAPWVGVRTSRPAEPAMARWLVMLRSVHAQSSRVIPPTVALDGPPVPRLTRKLDQPPYFSGSPPFHRIRFDAQTLACRSVGVWRILTPG